MKEHLGRTRGEQQHRTGIRVLVGLCVLATWNLVMVNAQRRSLHLEPGKVIAAGTNTVPVGDTKTKVISYHLEELTVKQTFVKDEFAHLAKDPLHKLRSEQLTQRAVKVLRLTLTGEFPGDYVVWVNDQPIRSVLSHPERLTVMLNAAVRLEDGATLAVSEHGGGSGDLRAPRTVLPDRLRVPPEYQTPHSPPATDAVSLRRVAKAGQLLGKPGIELEIDGVEHVVRDNAQILQIGSEEFGLSRHSSGAIIFTLTLEEFARVKDGDRIILKWGSGLTSGTNFGKLDKSLLRTDADTKRPLKRI